MPQHNNPSIFSQPPLTHSLHCSSLHPPPLHMHSSFIHPGLPCSAKATTAEKGPRTVSQPGANPPPPSSPQASRTRHGSLLPPHAALSQCSQGADALRTNTHLFTKLGAHPCGLHGQSIVQRLVLSPLSCAHPYLSSLLFSLNSLSHSW